MTHHIKKPQVQQPTAQYILPMSRRLYQGQLAAWSWKGRQQSIQAQNQRSGTQCFLTMPNGEQLWANLSVF